MTQPFRYTTRTYDYAATMPAGTDRTGVIDMIGTPLIGIQFPLRFKGDELFINVSTDGSTFIKLLNPQGHRMSVKACPNCYVCVSPVDFIGIRYIQLESNKIESEERAMTVYGRIDS